MKIYELIFSTPDAGFQRVWVRNMKGVKKILKADAADGIPRDLLSTEYVEIPTLDKTEMIEWLNRNASTGRK